VHTATDRNIEMYIPHYLITIIALVLWWHYCVKPAIEHERKRKREIRESEEKQREELEWYERMNQGRRARGEKEIWPWYEEPPWEKEFQIWKKSRSSRTVQEIVDKITELSAREAMDKRRRKAVTDLHEYWEKYISEKGK